MSPRSRTFLAVRLALVAGGGLLLFGCGSSPSSTGTTTTQVSTTTTVASSTSSTSTTAPANPCSTGVMSASATTGGSAAGSAYETFTVTNNGPSACVVDGFPTLTFFGASAAGGAGAGPQLNVTIEHSDVVPTPVSIASKGSAEFLVLFSDVPVGGVACDTVASANVGLPGSAESLSLPVSMDLCGGSVRLDPFGSSGSENP